jgi:trk system potassium uptake protein TrkH
MKLINPVSIIRILGLIMLIEAVSMLTCIPVALIYDESAWPFVMSVIISGLIAGLIRLPGRNAALNNISNRDTFLVVTLAWVFIALAGSLPYLMSGTIRHL